jgi:hypothetical protein
MGDRAFELLLDNNLLPQLRRCHMTQGAPVLAGMTNTASQTTDITLVGPNVGLSVTAVAPTPNAPVVWAGIAVNSVDPGSDALYAIGRGRGVFAVGLDGEGLTAESHTTDGLKGTCRLPGKAGVVGVNTSTGEGVFGKSEGGTGVLGTSVSGIGVSGTTVSGIGVRGLTTGGGNPIAILAENASGNPEGVAVVALGGAGVGVHASGARAAIRLSPIFGLTGAPTTGFHSMGELMVDAVGDLFLCKKTGTPGTWVKVA